MILAGGGFLLLEFVEAEFISFVQSVPCSPFTFLGLEREGGSANTEMEMLPLVFHLAEQAEEEYKVERSGAREEEEREGD